MLLDQNLAIRFSGAKREDHEVKEGYDDRVLDRELKLREEFMNEKNQDDDNINIKYNDLGPMIQDDIKALSLFNNFIQCNQKVPSDSSFKPIDGSNEFGHSRSEAQNSNGRDSRNSSLGGTDDGSSNQTSSDNGSQNEDCGLLSLSEALTQVNFSGFIIPDWLLLSGPIKALQAIRLSWLDGNLKAPVGYKIETIGQIRSVQVDRAGKKGCEMEPTRGALMIGQPRSMANKERNEAQMGIARKSMVMMMTRGTRTTRATSESGMGKFLERPNEEIDRTRYWPVNEISDIKSLDESLRSECYAITSNKIRDIRRTRRRRSQQEIDQIRSILLNSLIRLITLKRKRETLNKIEVHLSEIVEHLSSINELDIELIDWALESLIKDRKINLRKMNENELNSLRLERQNKQQQQQQRRRQENSLLNELTNSVHYRYLISLMSIHLINTEAEREYAQLIETTNTNSDCRCELKRAPSRSSRRRAHSTTLNNINLNANNISISPNSTSKSKSTTLDSGIQSWDLASSTTDETGGYAISSTCRSPLALESDCCSSSSNSSSSESNKRGLDKRCRTENTMTAFEASDHNNNSNNNNNNTNTNTNSANNNKPTAKTRTTTTTTTTTTTSNPVPPLVSLGRRSLSFKVKQDSNSARIGTKPSNDPSSWTKRRDLLPVSNGSCSLVNEQQQLERRETLDVGIGGNLNSYNNVDENSNRVTAISNGNVNGNSSKNGNCNNDKKIAVFSSLFRSKSMRVSSSGSASKCENGNERFTTTRTTNNNNNNNCDPSQNHSGRQVIGQMIKGANTLNSSNGSCLGEYQDKTYDYLSTAQPHKRTFSLRKGSLLGNSNRRSKSFRSQVSSEAEQVAPAGGSSRKLIHFLRRLFSVRRSWSSSQQQTRLAVSIEQQEHEGEETNEASGKLATTTTTLTATTTTLTTHHHHCVHLIPAAPVIGRATPLRSEANTSTVPSAMRPTSRQLTLSPSRASFRTIDQHEHTNRRRENPDLISDSPSSDSSFGSSSLMEILDNSHRPMREERALEQSTKRATWRQVGRSESSLSDASNSTVKSSVSQQLRRHLDEAYKRHRNCTNKREKEFIDSINVLRQASRHALQSSRPLSKSRLARQDAACGDNCTRKQRDRDSSLGSKLEQYSDELSELNLACRDGELSEDTNDSTNCIEISSNSTRSPTRSNHELVAITSNELDLVRPKEEPKNIAHQIDLIEHHQNQHKLYNNQNHDHTNRSHNHSDSDDMSGPQSLMPGLVSELNENTVNQLKLNDMSLPLPLNPFNCPCYFCSTPARLSGLPLDLTCPMGFCGNGPLSYCPLPTQLGPLFGDSNGVDLSCPIWRSMLQNYYQSPGFMPSAETLTATIPSSNMQNIDQHNTGPSNSMLMTSGSTNQHINNFTDNIDQAQQQQQQQQQHQHQHNTTIDLKIEIGANFDEDTKDDSDGINEKIIRDRPKLIIIDPATVDSELGGSERGKFKSSRSSTRQRSRRHQRGTRVEGSKSSTQRAEPPAEQAQDSLEDDCLTSNSSSTFQTDESLITNSRKERATNEEPASMSYERDSCAEDVVPDADDFNIARRNKLPASKSELQRQVDDRLESPMRRQILRARLDLGQPGKLTLLSSDQFE